MASARYAASDFPDAIVIWKSLVAGSTWWNVRHSAQRSYPHKAQQPPASSIKMRRTFRCLRVTASATHRLRHQRLPYLANSVVPWRRHSLVSTGQTRFGEGGRPVRFTRGLCAGTNIGSRLHRTALRARSSGPPESRTRITRLKRPVRYRYASGPGVSIEAGFNAVRPPWSSGLGRLPFTQEIAGSNPAGGTPAQAGEKCLRLRVPQSR